MSVREEDRRKNTCSGRGLGLAAAAIGVGVGAAVYYFLNKRQENPDGEGSTAEGWVSENLFSPRLTNNGVDSDDDYATISEHTTTDTSVLDDTSESNGDDDTELIVSDTTGPDSHGSDTDSSDVEWVIEGSTDYPSSSSGDSFMGGLLNRFGRYLSPRTNRQTRSDPITRIREERFRQRSWSLEECSICCDVMLKDQQLKTLACSHNFHAACVQPWLEEHETCPNCRKKA